ncbi:MAG: hypothetical protein SNG49_03545 [Rikenellaceae bacterium]
MLNIYPEIYEKLAILLEEKIEGKSFFSDRITFEDSATDYLFTATLMIYYTECRYPEGYENIIVDIVPVWWEFHSTEQDGEKLNDFDFELLKEVICN